MSAGIIRSMILPPSYRQWMTRGMHRIQDLKEIVAFSLCPLSSWSTELILPACSNANSSNHQNRGGAAPAINLHIRIDQWTRLGSGGFAWSAARRLAALLQEHGEQGCRSLSSSLTMTTDEKEISRPWSGLNVIELGAGTGMLGIAVAGMGANVTLTDQANFEYPGDNLNVDSDDDDDDDDDDESSSHRRPSLIDLLQRNVQNNWNLTQNNPGQANIQVHEMLWGSAKHHAALPKPGKFDLIIAADILLFTSAHHDLINTLKALSTPKTIILIQHTDREDGSGDTYPQDMMRFLYLLGQDNLKSSGKGDDEDDDGTMRKRMWWWNPQIIHDHGRHITLRISRSTTSCGGGSSSELTPFQLEKLPPRRQLLA